MTDYTRVAIADADAHAKFSSYDVMRAAVDAELVKVSTAIGTKYDTATATTALGLKYDTSTATTALAGKQDVRTSQAMTVSGAVTPGVGVLTLDHTSTKIAATIATAVAHAGVFFVKAITEPGAENDHTVTITTGSWDGTNKVATFADNADALLVYFDTAGKGIILANTGAVALS